MTAGGRPAGVDVVWARRTACMAPSCRLPASTRPRIYQLTQPAAAAAAAEMQAAARPASRCGRSRTQRFAIERKLARPPPGLAWPPAGISIIARHVRRGCQFRAFPPNWASLRHPVRREILRVCLMPVINGHLSLPSFLSISGFCF